MNVVSVATNVVVIALVALLVAVATTRVAGTALFAAGVTLFINDALLAPKFATILGFGHLSLADSIGLWPASAFLVLSISSIYRVVGALKRRWLVAVMCADGARKLARKAIEPVLRIRGRPCDHNDWPHGRVT